MDQRWKGSILPLRSHLDKARAAIFNRLLALCDLSGSHEDEEGLLEEALRQLWVAENKNHELN